MKPPAELVETKRATETNGRNAIGPDAPDRYKDECEDQVRDVRARDRIHIAHASHGGSNAVDAHQCRSVRHPLASKRRWWQIWNRRRFTHRNRRSKDRRQWCRNHPRRHRFPRRIQLRRPLLHWHLRYRRWPDLPKRGREHFVFVSPLTQQAKPHGDDEYPIAAAMMPHASETGTSVLCLGGNSMGSCVEQESGVFDKNLQRDTATD